MRIAASCAIDTNPDVAAKYQAFQASREEIDVARGGLMPRVDLNSEAARKWDKVTTRQPEAQSVVVTGLSVTATQLLWDGMATQSQVDRLNHTSKTRYYEFLDVTEQVALEAVRAHADVARALALVRLAEENLQQHQAFNSRQATGTLRGADSQGNAKQTEARKILAQSNLFTERSNLHDVMERYRRIVGMVPTTSLTLQDSESARALQDSTKTVNAGALIDQAIHKSAQVRAAIANLQSARAQAQEGESAYQPKVEARVRSGVGQNMDGIADKTSETKAGVALNWNLYNGGSDQAKMRQQAKLIEQAVSQRDRACRDARQVAAIAANDVAQLTEQVRFHTSNVEASELARKAILATYDQGAASGQAKTRVIDVLNAENEVYTAKRARTNAEHDLFIAKARVRAATGELLNTLELKRSNSTDAETAPDNGGAEEATQCPVMTDPPVLPATLPGASGLSSPLSTNIVGGGSVSDESLSQSPTLRGGAPASSAAQTAAAQSVKERLSAWVGAWQAKDVSGYVAFYDQSFSPVGVTREKWLDNRSRLLSKNGPIQIKLTNEKVRVINAETVEITFNQSYSSNNFSDTTQKTLLWKRIKGTWVITQEKSKR
ncbi:TolC family protein [Leptothrix ochracea]|uniref:TolC family protein n=1 Tax=Leptothrix ochracea TaxID=735331 RepID=UPI000693D71E|nr:TolC family protein [Leptothrix ochracea]